MSIFVSEPGRPIGTRLPEAFRSRRVGDVTELARLQEAGVMSPLHRLVDGWIRTAQGTARQR